MHACPKKRLQSAESWGAVRISARRWRPRANLKRRIDLRNAVSKTSEWSSGNEDILFDMFGCSDVCTTELASGARLGIFVYGSWLRQKHYRRPILPPVTARHVPQPRNLVALPDRQDKAEYRRLPIPSIRFDRLRITLESSSSCLISFLNVHAIVL